MRQILYVIDQTSRQHGYEIPEAGLKVKIGNNEHLITKDDPQIELFYAAVETKTPFVIYGKKNVTLFNPNTITGVQYSVE